MTDRLKGCTVVFSHDIREDDAEFILNAIRMIKGVEAVEPVLTENGDMIIEMRMEREFSEFLYETATRYRDRHKKK